MPARRQAISASPGGAVAQLDARQGLVHPGRLEFRSKQPKAESAKGKSAQACAKLPTARGHPARFAGCLPDKRAICPRAVRQLVHPGGAVAQFNARQGLVHPGRLGPAATSAKRKVRKDKSARAYAKLSAARGHPARFAGCSPGKRAKCPRAVRPRSQRAKRMQNSFDKSGPPPTLVSSPGGVVAQLAERLNGIQEVRGSNPLGSTIPLPAPAAAAFSGATL